MSAGRCPGHCHRGCVSRRAFLKGSTAVLAGSGRVYTGVNVEACGYGPCAEPIAAN